jgi:hypothetical protein
MSDDDDDVHDQVAPHWCLDRRIPLALILTIVGQTVVAAWAASNLWTRVGMLERQADYTAPRLESVAKLEVKVDSINLQLVEIKNLIRQVQADKR